MSTLEGLVQLAVRIRSFVLLMLLLILISAASLLGHKLFLTIRFACIFAQEPLMGLLKRVRNVQTLILEI